MCSHAIVRTSPPIKDKKPGDHVKHRVCYELDGKMYAAAR
jgi:hypothetical protein